MDGRTTKEDLRNVPPIIKLQDARTGVQNCNQVVPYTPETSKTPSNKCWWCDNSVGTIYHIFLECDKIQTFWQQVKTVIILDPKPFVFHVSDTPLRVYKNLLKSHMINAARACIPTRRIDCIPSRLLQPHWRNMARLEELPKISGVLELYGKGEIGEEKGNIFPFLFFILSLRVGWGVPLFSPLGQEWDGRGEWSKYLLESPFSLDCKIKCLFISVLLYCNFFLIFNK